jgi:hypothetical protein
LIVSDEPAFTINNTISDDIANLPINSSTPLKSLPPSEPELELKALNMKVAAKAEAIEREEAAKDA